MSTPEPIVDWMRRRDMSIGELADSARLEKRVVAAIVQQGYTTSPQQRQRIADTLGVTVDQIAWSQTVPVDHMYGHGPQFGRSP